jgi:hypothetical protein
MILFYTMFKVLNLNTLILDLLSKLLHQLALGVFLLLRLLAVQLVFRFGVFKKEI